MRDLSEAELPLISSKRCVTTEPKSFTDTQQNLPTILLAFINCLQTDFKSLQGHRHRFSHLFSYFVKYIEHQSKPSSDAPTLSLTYHLEVIDAAVNSSEHLLPLLWGFRAWIKRGTKPGHMRSVLAYSIKHRLFTTPRTQHITVTIKSGKLN